MEAREVDSLLKQGHRLFEELPPELVESDVFGHPVCPRCVEEARAAQKDVLPPPPELEVFESSAVVSVLEYVWREIQTQVPEVPDAVVAMASGTEDVSVARMGHWGASRWRVEGGEHRGEVFVAGEAFERGGIFVMSVLLHEAAHALADARGLKDTSRQGRYHNQVFRELAEELGLEVSRRDPHGFCETALPSRSRQDRWFEAIRNLETVCRAGSREKPPKQGRGATGRKQDAGELAAQVSAPNPSAPVGQATAALNETAFTASVAHESETNGLRVTLACGCSPARKIRVVPSVASLGPIICGVCQRTFGRADRRRY